MDARNDDSGGSDSLDKSLEKKCVVQDGTESEDSIEELDYLAGQLLGMVEPLGNSAEKQKTDDGAGIGDAVVAASSSGSGVGGSGGLLSHLTMAVNFGRDNSSVDANPIRNLTSTQQQQQQQIRNFEIETQATTTTTTSNVARTSATFGLEVEVANSVNTTTQLTATNNNNNNNNNNIGNNLLSATTADSTAIVAATAAAAAAAAAAASKSETKAFESKVKQISKNLKETTLAENPIKKASLEDSSSSSSPSSSSSSDCDTLAPTASATQIVTAANTNTNQQEVTGDKDTTTTTTTTTLLITNLSTNAADTAAQTETETATATSASTAATEMRTKKVRFHPDAKENDGGNRIVSKKKKKFKSTIPSANDEEDDGTTTQTIQKKNYLDGDEEMECDDDEAAYEQEEQFDLAKTIAEAQDYLKAHPLTFVRPLNENNIIGLTNGFTDENCVEQMDESSDEEFPSDEMLAENGIQRILGKHIKNGQVEFLCRYVEKAGLFWETEESLGLQCPNMLYNYECNREKRQARLMRHVAERQNMRQRYTDF